MRLYPAIPNPFEGVTTFAFALSQAGPVRLGIHDATGRLVATLDGGSRAAGHHAVEWNGRDASGNGVAPGIYFVTLTASNEVRTQKVVVQAPLR